MELHTAFRLVLALSGTVFGLIATSIFREINNETETAMASFQLKPEDSIRDFEILLIGQIFMILGFFSYFLGGFLEIEKLLIIGRFMAIMFSIVPIATFYRWWRRF